MTLRHPSPQHAVVEARDGFPLAVRVHVPREPARATLLIHSATAVPQSYYARFAEWAAARGVRVVTYDYRGVGGSRPASLKELEARMSDWATLDAAAVIEWVKGRWDGPLVALGHSFGGQLIGLIDEAHEVDGEIFVAAQLGYMGHWPARDKPKLALFWYGLVPALTATVGYLPAWGGLGEELPSGVAREWSKWCRSERYYLDHVPGSEARLARFDRPTLVFSFTDDDIGPPGAVDALLDTLSAAPIEHRRVAPADLNVRRIGHFGFFRAGFEDTLWPEALAFIDRIAAPRARAA